MLQHIISRCLLFPFSEVIAVIGYEAKRIQHSIQIHDSRFRWVYNPDYGMGQSSSLWAGLKECHQGRSVMVFLGDQPLISPGTIQFIFQSGLEQQNKSDEPCMFRPSYQNLPGHPVFLGNIKQMSFRNLKGDQGAKDIIRHLKNRNLVPVEDPGVTFDIDTPEAYKRAKTMMGKGWGV
ncbi:molybdenum cofactor cytidylyltransferase [Melghirimyces profundicolus]|uniref:Molybdenum cofactor cytidylyltransferase n=1 Tax=Melghirimyces profundicolus TaxID=1242148 RepID=A0A2T6BZ20_9BACL|nr:molybdenum cofactor cytidylyltransferase [Melghirimyces profundicolus]